MYSATVPYPENEYIITGLRPSTEYTVNVRAQCQVDTALASPGSEALFTTQGRPNGLPDTYMHCIHVMPSATICCEACTMFHPAGA